MDRFTIDRGRPGDITERNLAPERRVGARKKVAPEPQEPVPATLLRSPPLWPPHLEALQGVEQSSPP